jgi:hypothetical protein
MRKLDDGLHKKRTAKHYDKVLPRLGRLKQQHSCAAQYYDIEVEHDEKTAKATPSVGRV